MYDLANLEIGILYPRSIKKRKALFRTMGKYGFKNDSMSFYGSPLLAESIIDFPYRVGNMIAPTCGRTPLWLSMVNGTNMRCDKTPIEVSELIF